MEFTRKISEINEDNEEEHLAEVITSSWLKEQQSGEKEQEWFVFSKAKGKFIVKYNKNEKIPNAIENKMLNMDEKSKIKLINSILGSISLKISFKSIDSENIKIKISHDKILNSIVESDIQNPSVG
jgi:hypothetical protein